MFFSHLHHKILFSFNIFQKFCSKDVMLQYLKRHVMTSLQFQINKCVQNDFSKPTSSSYTKLSFSLIKKKYSKISDKKCWNCQQFSEFKQCICPVCGFIQYPKKDINYFELFGISQTFDINLEELSMRFRNLQMTFHPDKFLNKSKAELEISEFHSRTVNKAYTILKNPLARGYYLLELKNISVNDSYPIGKDFLMAIMEKNEELECIASKNVLKQFMKQITKKIENQIHLISENFRHNNFNEASINLLKLNYFLNLETKVKEKESDFN